MLGNEWLSPHATRIAAEAAGRGALELCEALSAALDDDPAPMPVSVVVGEVWHVA